MEDKDLRLLKNGKKGLHRILFSRMGLVLLFLLLNIGLLFSFFHWFEAFLPHIYGGSALFMVIMVLILINSPMDPTAKITWLVVIMLTPVFGGLLYLFVRRDVGHRAMVKRVESINRDTAKLLPANEDAENALRSENPGAAALAKYIQRSCGCPVYQNTQVQYFPLGEDKFAQLLTELEKAEKFIFLEYFIVDEGHMWGSVLEILARKAAAGVDVRMMYDGACEFLLLPKGYPKKLKELGIQCRVFSPATPFVSTHYNYRDHRKIAVIDGHTAFTGGVNLADEYINIGSRFGHWKDTAVMMKGPAVASYTLMFLQMWNIPEKNPDYTQIETEVPELDGKGFVVPYGDSPLDQVRLGQQVYMDILARAERYVHIMTPYLILDQEMENALKYAAARGVDVKIIMPGIPDKKAVNILGKSYYKVLLESGVEIYEYTPGFVHAKVFVSDDREAVVGTINLDYRSLYHHFECAAYLYGTDCVADIEKDLLGTAKKSKNVTLMDAKQEKWYRKLTGYVLKVASPLL